MDDEQAIKVTEMIIQTLEGFGAVLTGQPMPMNDLEKMSIYTSMPGMLKSMKQSTIDRFSGVLLPFALAVGLGSYSIRTVRTYNDARAYAEYRQQYEAQGEEVFTPSDNGAKEPTDGTPIDENFDNPHNPDTEGRPQWSKMDIAQNRRMP